MQSKLMPFRFQEKRSQQFQVRMKQSIAQKRKVKTWNPQQDELLFQLYDRFPKKWNQISEMMGNRNENQCLHRFRRLVSVGQHKKIWSPEQDHTVLEMIKKYGNNWKLIAATLKSKTGKQIRQRYINKLDPSIKFEEWSQAEDFKIIELYTKHGSKWSQISRMMEGRPQNKIKNRFYSFIQKNYDIVIKDDPKDEIKDQVNNTYQQTPQQSSIMMAAEHNSKHKIDSNQLSNIYKNFLYAPQLSKKGSTSKEQRNKHEQLREGQSLEQVTQNNKENKEKQNMEKHHEKCNNQKHHDFSKHYQKQQDSSKCKKSMEEEWSKSRQLQQINQPNEIAQGNEDFFYFQDN